MTVARYHSQSSEADPSALRSALDFTVDRLQEVAGEIMGLALQGKASLAGTVRELLGDEMTKGLDRNNRVQRKGVTVQLLTEKIQVRKLEGPVLAIFVAPQRLQRIVAAQGTTHLVFAPQTEADLSDYLSLYPDSTPIADDPGPPTPVHGIQEA